MITVDENKHHRTSPTNPYNVSSESLEKVSNAFTDTSVLTTSDLISLTGLSRITVRRCIEDLTLLGKLKQLPYEKRIGYRYTLASNEVTRVLGEGTVTPVSILSFLLDHETSPYLMISNEVWNRVRKVVLFKTFEHSRRVEIPVSSEVLDKINDQMIEETSRLLKLLMSFRSPDWTHPEGINPWVGQLDSVSGALNTFNEVLASVSGSTDPTTPVSED